MEENDIRVNFNVLVLKSVDCDGEREIAETSPVTSLTFVIFSVYVSGKHSIVRNFLLSSCPYI